MKRIAITATMCGGISPYDPIPNLRRLVLFSREQIEKMKVKYKWPASSLTVIRNRVDTTLFDHQCAEAKAHLQSLGVDLDSPVVMMVTTFLSPKVLSIKQTIQAMKDVLKTNPHVTLVMVGGKGEFFKEALEVADKINQQFDRKVIVFTGLVTDAYRYLNYADVVIGQGRSAFEGMGYGKPTLIVGDNGYAGTVISDTVEDLGYCNFSGRNQTETAPVSVLGGEILKILSDHDYRNQCSSFARKFLAQELDVESGIARLEGVYNENKEWFEHVPKFNLLWNVIRSLSPIILDNYINALKRVVLKK